MNKETIFSMIRTYVQENPPSSTNAIRLHEPTFAAEEINVMVDQMLSTRVTMGEEVAKFEQDYAEKLGYQYAVMCNSGSSANLLAISALVSPLTEDSIPQGAEVLVPALSWSTTVWPLIQCGLTPVFVDADIHSFNFDLDKLEQAITPKTKAIMLVHVYGNPCNMDQIMQLANQYHLQIIEDSCESMGAYYRNQSVGSFGRVGTFSLYFSHHMTTLEGGLCVTDDFELAETMKIMRAHGWSRESKKHQAYVDANPHIDPRFLFVNLGYNLRPTECQGRMGQVQLTKLESFVKQRRQCAHYYQKQLANYESFFSLQQETPQGESSYFGLALLLKPNLPFELKRLTSYLKERSIENRPIIAGNMSKHPIMQHYHYVLGSDLNVADYIMNQGMALPCHQDMNETQVDRIVGTIDDFLKRYI